MNQCDGCTACCTSFRIDWLNKPPNTECIHCDNGCTIHDSKHSECSDFNCAYIQSNVENDSLRPDKCGIIFEKIDDTTFFGTVIKDAKVTDVARRQMSNFVKQGFKVLLSSEI